MAEAAPAVFEKIMEDSLKCSICLEVLATPRALPCLHTFCEACIQSVISASKKTAKKLKFCCPDCRHETKLAIDKDTPVERMAEKLPLNFTVKNIIEGIHDATNQIEASTAVDSGATGGVVPEVSFHNLDLCNIHTTDKLEFYCNRHQTVLCKKCKRNKHWLCSITKIEQKVAKGSDSQAVFEEMSALQSEFEESINTMLKNVQEITVQVDGFPETIDSLEKELRTVIRKVRTAVADKNEEIKDTTTKTQKETIAGSMNWLMVLDTLRDDLELVSQHGTDVQSFIAAHHVQQQLGQLWDESARVRGALQCVSLRLALIDVLKGVLAVTQDLLVGVETRTYTPTKL